jgi:hypothetical protein
MNIIQVYKQFPTQQDCIKHLEKVRWNNEPTCPYCQSKNQSPYQKKTDTIAIIAILLLA